MAKKSVFRKLSKSINFLYTRALRYGVKLAYRRQYASLLSRHPHGHFAKEKEYVKMWKKLDRHPDLKTYRLFAQYVGEDPNIVAEDIVAGYIQPLLNPIEYRPYYQDKNMFDKILSPEWLPKTLLRGIRGRFYDMEYSVVENLEEVLDKVNEEESVVFLKPAVDSSSGEGVVCFKRGEDGNLKSIDTGEPLCGQTIMAYIHDYPDFILQEGLSQHPDLSRFNPSSINTIRMVTYRSSTDNKVHFLNAIIRIGKCGAHVDNAHAGGIFVGLDNSGKLGKYACDQYGNKYDSFNGVNFSNNAFTIPEFDKLINFVEKIGDKILHADLVAHDIGIEADGTFKLIEFNIRGFSTWLFQYTCGSAFGKWTPEIIEYCVKNKDKISKVFVDPN